MTSNTSQAKTVNFRFQGRPLRATTHGKYLEIKSIYVYYIKHKNKLIYLFVLFNYFASFSRVLDFFVFSWVTSYELIVFGHFLFCF